MKIDSIKVEGRHRHDLGDIAGLAASMDEVGLLQPVVITTDRRLVAGERRLVAARHLGWEEVKVTVVESLDDADALLRAERDENTCRKAFTPTEAEEIASAIEAALKPLSKPGPKPKDGGKFPPSGKLRDAAAAGTGYSEKTIRKVRETKAVARDESKPKPVREAASKALADMDDSGKVDGAYKAVKQTERAAELIGEFPELDHYGDDPATVIRLGEALRGYDEPERTSRREALRRTIAADRRRDDEPTPEAEPDYYLLAQDMFRAANAAAQAITNKGGADTFAAAIERGVDQLAVQNWEDQFAELAAKCRQVASACQPKLRRIK